MFPISDHSIIKTVLVISKPQIMKQSLNFRKLKGIDHSKLSSTLKSSVESLLNAGTSSDVPVLRNNNKLTYSSC